MPHCKKPQHWSPTLRNYAASQSWSDERRKKENRGVGCGMAICGFWGGAILAIPAIGLIPDTASRTAIVIATLIGCIVLGEALTFIIGKRLVNRGNAKNAALLKELEGLEKNEPRFIAWEEVNSGLRGISVR